MIRAAAACAEGKAPPPPELVLAWQCDRWHALPYSGGVLDQPAGLLGRMLQLLNVYETMRSWHLRRAGEEKDWIEAHPQGWEIVRQIERLRRNG